MKAKLKVFVWAMSMVGEFHQRITERVSVAVLEKLKVLMLVKTKGQRLVVMLVVLFLPMLFHNENNKGRQLYV